jgi:hypothetical protein
MMYGNARFDLAHESNVELLECLRLRYSFQAAINPKAHAILSKICTLGVDVCNQMEVYFDGIDSRFEQLFDLLDQSLPTQHVSLSGETGVPLDRHDKKGNQYEISTIPDREGHVDPGKAPERLLRSDCMFPAPPVMAFHSKNPSRSLASETNNERPEPDVNFLWLMDFGMSSYESWRRREQNKLKKAILTLESFITNHGP